MMQRLLSENIHIVARNASIYGSFNVSSTLSLRATNGTIEVVAGLTSKTNNTPTAMFVDASYG
jgi:hypothetical protein